MILGSHLSISGGLHRALESAGDYGFDCVAMFVRNQRQWRAGALSDEAIATFHEVRRRLKIAPVVAHGSYLVNLAGKPDVRRKSIIAMSDELDRCERLGIEYLVFHPGSHENEDEGIALVAEALGEIVAEIRGKTKILIETTAGQGHYLGRTFEQIAEILARLERQKRFGVCLDTCHIFAAGYDIRTPKAYRKTVDEFDKVIGIGQLLAIHLNDSVGELGSRVDRHTHIGEGKIGLAGFAEILNDRRLADLPMILETPKGADEAGRDWDDLNVASLRGLVQ
ncbi:MAG: deoxyribonuclease IV [Planctomycetota bacterium]|nr:deoxyribonuclease IV [Planctomycetota bacterium]